MGKQKLFRVQALNEKGMSSTVKDALALAAILAALAMGLRLDLALDPCAADIDARPVTCPQ